MGLLSKIISLGIVISSLYPQLKSLRFKKEIPQDSEEPLEEPSERALLKEYEACQLDINSSSQSYWTLAGIFIGFTSVLLGGLLYGVLSNSDIFYNLFTKDATPEKLILGIVIIILSTAVLVILYFLRGWLKRVQFLARLNYIRMREIELHFNMRKSWRIQSFDQFKEGKRSELQHEIEYKYDKSVQERKKLENELSEFYTKWQFTYERPSSKLHFSGIFCTLIVMWSLVLISGITLLYFYCPIVMGISLGLLAFIGITIFFYKKNIWPLR